MCRLIKPRIEEIKGYVARYLPLLTDWLGRGATTHVCIVGAKGWTTTPAQQPHVLSAAEQKKVKRTQTVPAFCWPQGRRPSEHILTQLLGQDATYFTNCSKLEYCPYYCWFTEKFIWPNILQVPPKKLISVCTACQSAVSTKLDCSVCSIYILGLYQLLHSSSPPAHIQQQQQVFINGNRRGREIGIIETGWYLVIISYRKLYFCSLEYFDYGELSLDQVRFKSSWLEEFKFKVEQGDRVVCQIGSWRKIKPQNCLLVPVNWPPYCVQKLLLRERDSI